MNKRLQHLILAGLPGLMMATPVFAQENEPGQPSTSEAGETAPEEEVSASQEVEITEDNYRQFMELKDAMRQRDVIPENVFKPGSGLQKLDKLPEESQKHLRNQLREIIVDGDPWQPGDEETEYPYTPSAAAGSNPELEKQELEAWGELVDSYHERESQIYENSSGPQAARGSEQGSNNSQQNGKGQPGSDSQNGEGSQGQQPGQENSPDQTASEGTFSVNGSGDPNARNTAGVSQNAMEFLQGLGNGGNGEKQAGNGATEGTGEQGDPSTLSEAQAAQQNMTEQGIDPSPARQPNAASTAGSAQNAMEFLKGNTGQGNNSGETDAASSEGNEAQGETRAGKQGETRADSQQNGRQVNQAQGQDAAGGDGEDNAQEGEQAGDQGDGEADGENNEQAQDAQQTETTEKSTSSISPEISDPAPPAETDEESTAGASQNALEYLTGEGDQADEGANNDPDTSQPAGTLTIQDLLNARGVGDSTGADPGLLNPGDEQPPDEISPDKDSDG